MSGLRSSRRVTPAAYRRVVLVAGALLALIVVTGASVRLTQSGLGCEDWPTCSEDRLVPEWEFHGWIEFGNRLLSGVVALGVAAAVLGARRLDPPRPDLERWAWFLVAGVVAQIVLGGITVLVELHPVFVGAHFLLSMVLLWNTVVLWHRAKGGPGTAVARIPPSLVAHSRTTVAAATVLLVTGTIVTGAGPNSGDVRAERLDVSLVTAARLHGVVAWITLAALVTLATRMLRSGLPVRRFVPVLTACVVQGAIGYTQYALGVPPGVVILHIVGAIVVWMLVVDLHLGWFERPPAVAPNPPAPSRLVDA